MSAAALGCEQIDLFGLSYGTRFALVYMRRHPGRTRSAVLMGVAPTDLAMPLHHAPDGQRALELMFTDCAADAGCRRSFPRLREETSEVLDRLRGAPAAVTLADGRSGRTATYHLTRGAFAEQLRTRLYAPSSRSALPLAIHAASQGDFGPFLKPLRSGGGGPEIAEGLYLSVRCAEDVPFIDPAEAERLADFRRPVESKTPTLILSGERDPITPPRLGEQVVRHLPNGRHLVIPQGAHVPDGLEPVACVDHVMLRFFETPTEKDLDAGCLKDMRAQPFVLPSP